MIRMGNIFTEDMHGPDLSENTILHLSCNVSLLMFMRNAALRLEVDADRYKCVRMSERKEQLATRVL
jgi:hypothetical protein